MRLLEIDVDAARAGVFAGRNGLIAGRATVQLNARQFGLVAFEERIAEHAERGLVGFQFLHDDVVVLAGLHIGAILAHRLPDRLEGLGVLVLQRLQAVDGQRALFEEQLVQRVARARSWRGAKHFDLFGGQRGVDLGPLGVRIVDQLALVVRHFGGQRQEHLFQRQFHRRTVLGLGQRQAIKTNVQLDDAGDAILGASLELGLLDAARGVGGVGFVLAGALAENFHAAAGAGGFDHGRLAVGLAELLGDRSGERIDGGRADDADLVAGGEGGAGGK